MFPSKKNLLTLLAGKRLMVKETSAVILALLAG